MWRASRIAGGIACMLFVGWAVDSYHDGESIWEPISCLVVAFAGWAFAECKADASAPAPAILHPHDIELGNALRGILNERLKGYLKGHPVSTTFLLASFDPVSELSRWNGPEREFENQELDNLASEAVRLAHELDGQIGEHANIVEHNLDFASLAPDQERASDWYTRETSVKIQKVNTIATRLAEAGDNFERAFRRLSPESYRRNIEDI